MSGTIHRFFVPRGTVADRASLPLPGEIAHQVLRVLRMHDGERLVLLEGDGIEHDCRLDGGSLAVVERRPAVGEPRHRLTIVQALLKGDALEAAVRAATEVGAAAFRLVLTERHRSPRPVREEARAPARRGPRGGRAVGARVGAGGGATRSARGRDRAGKRRPLGARRRRDAAAWVVGATGGGGHRSRGWLHGRRGGGGRARRCHARCPGPRILRAETVAAVAMGIICRGRATSPRLAACVTANRTASSAASSPVTSLGPRLRGRVGDRVPRIAPRAPTHVLVHPRRHIASAHERPTPTGDSARVRCVTPRGARGWAARRPDR